MFVCVLTSRKERVGGGNLEYLTASGSCEAGSGIDMPLKYELLENISMCLGVRSPVGERVLIREHCRVMS